VPHPPKPLAKGHSMLRGALLWLIGLPIPIILLLFLFDVI
jgi:hypothetical protein